MIEGLWIEMSSDKLRKILDRRVGYHEEKASWYKRQAASLSEHVEANPNVSNNPTQSLRNSQREHENKAAFFRTLAANIIPNETYRLSEQNCIRLEFYAQYF